MTTENTQEWLIAVAILASRHNTIVRVRAANHYEAVLAAHAKVVGALKETMPHMAELMDRHYEADVKRLQRVASTLPTLITYLDMMGFMVSSPIPIDGFKVSEQFYNPTVAEQVPDHEVASRKNGKCKIPVDISPKPKPKKEKGAAGETKIKRKKEK